MFASVGSTPAHAAEIGQLVAAIDQDKVAYTLNRLDIPRSRDVIDYLIQEARIIVRRRAVPDRATLRTQVRVYDQLVKQTCRDQAEDGASEKQHNGISQIDAQRPASFGSPRGGNVELEPQSIWYLALLAPVVAGLLAALAGGHFAYKQVLAFMFSRRSCKIAATLECGLDVIDGHIIVLGRKRCRFRPVAEDGYTQLEWLDDRDDCIMAVGPHRMLGRISSLHDTFARYTFDQQVSETVLEVLMKASSVAPKYVRTPASSSDLKKPDANAPDSVMGRTLSTLGARLRHHLNMG